MEEQINEMNKFFQGISVSAVDMLWHIAAALGVFLLGVVVKKLLRKLLDRLMKLRIKSHALPQARLDSLSAFAFAVYDCVAWFIIAVASISKLGVDVSSLLTVAGVGGIAVGLGAQTLVKDMLAGLMFFLENQFQPGDIITVGDVSGEVEKMTLRITEIREFSGDLHVIPNGEIRAVANSTRAYHRALVDISLDYNENLGHVMDVLKDELSKCYPGMDGLMEAPDCIGVTKLADSGVEMRIVAKCAVKQHWAVERELRRRIKDRFDSEGIELSLPQMVVHEKKER